MSRRHLIAATGKPDPDKVGFFHRKLAGMGGSQPGDKPTGDKLVESAKLMVTLWRAGQMFSGKPDPDKVGFVHRHLGGFGFIQAQHGNQFIIDE